jgi:integrase
MKSRSRASAPTTVKRTVPPGRLPNAEYRTREYLTEREVERLMKAAGNNRHGHRDATMILMAFRHGLRASDYVRFAGIRPISSMAGCTSIDSRMGFLPSTR